MNFNLSDYDVDSLRTLYERENENLKTQLLNGAQWEDVKELRFRITELSIALSRKIKSIQGANPAESTSSDIEGR
jgi:hypothetical protein